MNKKSPWDDYSNNWGDYRKDDYDSAYDWGKFLKEYDDDAYIKGISSKKTEEIQFLEISKNLLYLEDKPINEYIKDINDFKNKLKTINKCSVEEVIMLYGFLIKNYYKFSNQETTDFLENSILKYVKNSDISNMTSYIYLKNLHLINEEKILKILEDITPINNENKKSHIEYKQVYYYVKNNFNKLTKHQKNNFITKYKVKSKQHITLLNSYVANKEVINYGLLSNLNINSIENKQIVFEYIKMLLNLDDIDSIKYFAKNCYNISKEYLKFYNDKNDILLNSLFYAYPYEFFNEHKNINLNKMIENYTQEYLSEYNSIITDIKSNPKDIDKYKKLYLEKLDVKEIKSIFLLHLSNIDNELAKLYYSLDVSKIQKQNFNYNNLLQNEVLSKPEEYKHMISMLIDNIDILLDDKYKSIHKEIIDNHDMGNIKLNNDLFDIINELLPHMNSNQQKQYILNIENLLVSKLYNNDIEKVKISDDDLNKIILSLTKCNSEVFNNLYEYHILPNYNFLKEEHKENKEVIQYLDNLNILINKAKLKAELSENNQEIKKKISKI